MAVAYVLAAFAIAACGGESKTPNTALPAAKPTLSSAIQRVGPSLGISAELVQLCKLDVNETTRAPKFDYDRSDLQPGDREVLTKVAECLTTGPLKGRTVELVGRTDSRGESQYNLALGALRAGAVADYLAHLGVERTHVAVTSRGELDAEGMDENGWQLDRRVDITLAR
jgi:peptidoglycan-associated lipoprotein